LVHPSVSCANSEPVRNLNFNHTTSLKGSSSCRFELKLKDVVVALVTEDLIGRVFSMLFAVTPNCDVVISNLTRLNSDRRETSLALVLLTVDVVIVADLDSLQELTRPGSVEVGEHQVKNL